MVGQTTSQSNNGALGGCVVEQVWATDVAVDRGVVDDGVALLKMLESIFGEKEIGVYICVEGLDPLIPAN